jgi:hypothetical protein
MKVLGTEFEAESADLRRGAGNREPESDGFEKLTTDY